jgi:uncharacterized protein (DUF1800 family)
LIKASPKSFVNYSFRKISTVSKQGGKSMKTKNSHYLFIILSVCLLVTSFVVSVSAQETDPNPDSPTPILLSEPNSTRALAINSRKSRVTNPNKVNGQAFPVGKSKVVLYLTNLDLMPDEGANAFRVFAQDEKGTQFRFRVENLEQLTKGQDGIYALTVTLYDDLGYWGQPEANGDVLINVTWRGLTSNRVRLGLGKIGGNIRDDVDAKPTPVGTKPTQPVEVPETKYLGYKYSGDRTRFMEQATFGPTVDLDNRIRRIGLRTWLAEQFQEPYPTFPYPDVPFQPVAPPSLCNGTINLALNPPDLEDVPLTCFRDSYSQYLPQNWFFQEAFYGNAQLKHRVSWALAQIWVTSGVDVQQSSHIVNYHKILSNNAFGNWRNLMKEMTLSPTMGNYLDMATSTRNSPNENYAREVLQLFNIGLFMLNQDGTVQVDGTGTPIPSYDQNTVNNFTKVLTGWTYCGNPTNCPNYVNGTVDFKDPMWLNTGVNHDITAKTLFTYPGSTTTNIAACTGCTGTPLLNYANNSLDQALDNIFNHPNVPPFVSKQLIQQLVTSDPSPAYVQRVANVFANNGSSVRGDLKAVVRAILLDPEARGNNKTAANYGKLREPVLFATNLMRQFNVKSADGLANSDGVVNQLTNVMGQNVFRSPTVFNYYPPDYLVPGTTVLAPEFAILTTGTTVNRTNFVNTMVYSRVNIGTNIPSGTSISFADLQALAAADATGNRLLDALNTRLMHGTMPAAMRSSILTAVTAIVSTNPLARTQAAIYLIATSSQFQVQR